MSSDPGQADPSALQHGVGAPLAGAEAPEVGAKVLTLRQLMSMSNPERRG